MPTQKKQSPRLPDDPAEYQRFLDMAREVEADEDPAALDRAFKQVVKPKAARVDDNQQPSGGGKKR